MTNFYNFLILIRGQAHSRPAYALKLLVLSCRPRKAIIWHRPAQSTKYLTQNSTRLEPNQRKLASWDTATSVVNLVLMIRCCGPRSHSSPFVNWTNDQIVALKSDHIHERMWEWTNERRRDRWRVRKATLILVLYRYARGQWWVPCPHARLWYALSKTRPQIMSEAI